MSSSRTTRRAVAATALLILAGAVPGLNRWTGPRPARSQSPAVARPEAAAAADEEAIRAVDEAFVRGYNAGDGKALAALFTEDAEVDEADGARYQGRALVEKAFADTFAAAKGAKIAIEVGAIRFLTADAAKEEGRSIVTPARGAAVSRLYTVLYVKRDGRWLISGVREEADPLVRPHDRLKDLEWMAGDWIDEGSDAVVRVHGGWSDDGNFLIRTFTVKRRGRPVMSVTQRIGWDPLVRRFRSWEFDSEGGFGEGAWGRDGDRWVVKQTGVRPDGTTASATNVTTRESADRVRWASTDRVVGDESLPDDAGYVLVRVAPGPRPRTAPSPTPSPSPNAPRSPR